MEGPPTPAIKPRLGQSSSSFRLRSPSLNSLRLRRIFDLFDKNGDGLITVEELCQALDLLGLEADMSELESIVQCYIKPGNNGLEYNDFEALHQSLGDMYFGVNVGGEEGREGEEERAASGATTTTTARELQEEADLTEAFKVFDVDGDGFISAMELQVVLAKLGFSEGSEIGRVEQMIFSVDRNQDGRVDFYEFKDMMQNVLVRTS
ncbi:PREDICTED: calcium-binding protein CML42-like [Nelumbo nucifera]|uniref:Calcium-binding protein CML42-like n=1 Tax=Nelumbo nucifera TaxID=4432 RepID=A0A1U7YYF4_NELNU|nr:PREDICTED: calcium-binding protein CML42-like [Nelumbo nucifera]